MRAGRLSYGPLPLLFADFVLAYRAHMQGYMKFKLPLGSSGNSGFDSCLYVTVCERLT